MFDILGIQSPGYSFDGSCPSHSLQVNNLGSRIRLVNNLDSRIRGDPVLCTVLITSTSFQSPLINHFGSRIREDPVLCAVLIILGLAHVTFQLLQND